MEFRDNATEAGFRATVREFLKAEFPPEQARRATEWGLFNTAGRYGQEFADFMKAWNVKLNARGWGAPHWPKEYGGGGLSVQEQFVLNEEFAWARAPRSGGIGHGWAGPTIMVYGTDEQKSDLLPKILSGEHRWCQLFSEPGAGSDLASLQTRAVRDGDDYVVNGQKIWTSGAHMSEMGILVARTDPDAPKHRGISYFLVDMKTPGVTCRPFPNMLNNNSFNEVFFENARIPAKNRLGEENRGWYLATTTLDFERSGIATSVSHQLIVKDLVQFAKDDARARARVAANPGLRLELAERAVEANVEALICYRIISMQSRGEIPNKESSIAKLYSSELDVRLSVTGMHLAGMDGQFWDHDDPRAMNGRIPRFYLASTTSPIGGGTSEIQRNIIATRGLALPRG
ncbi:MAG: acyl-CoA dehydrogenase [Anaerolinea sp.]|nr:acyl-CoA dehydrogenase [Anaerolinea sp.]